MVEIDVVPTMIEQLSESFRVRVNGHWSAGPVRFFVLCFERGPRAGEIRTLQENSCITNFRRV